MVDHFNCNPYQGDHHPEGCPPGFPSSSRHRLTSFRLHWAPRGVAALRRLTVGAGGRALDSAPTTGSSVVGSLSSSNFAELDSRFWASDLHPGALIQDRASNARSCQPQVSRLSKSRPRRSLVAPGKPPGVAPGYAAGALPTDQPAIREVIPAASTSRSPARRRQPPWARGSKRTGLPVSAGLALIPLVKDIPADPLPARTPTTQAGKADADKGIRLQPLAATVRRARHQTPHSCNGIESSTRLG